MSSEQPEIHAYGFVTVTAVPVRQFVEAVVTVPGIRFAGRTVGSCQALVVAQVASLASLQDDILPAVAAHGAAAGSWTTASRTSPTFNMPVKRGKSVVGALVRLRTRDSAETIAGLEEAFAGLNDEGKAGHHASALRTFGANCDVLLDLGAPDDAALFGHLDKLDQLPAVTTYDVTLSHWVDNGLWVDV